jgi:hypothetical protein
MVPPSQFPQLTGLPQLSVVLSQRPVHQPVEASQVQALPMHDRPIGHCALQPRICPQLSGPVPQ